VFIDQTVNGYTKTFYRDEWILKNKVDTNFVISYAGKTYLVRGDERTKEVYSESIGLPGEDLSESVAMYMIDPTKLEENSQEKYNFIKDKIFDGRQFGKGEVLH